MRHLSLRLVTLALVTSCGGSEAPVTSTERSVDVSKLGAECSTSADCAAPQRCLFFSGVDRSLKNARCYAGDDPCSIVKCPTGWSCYFLASFPGQIACER
jgi:hypothetical protein